MSTNRLLVFWPRYDCFDRRADNQCEYEWQDDVKRIGKKHDYVVVPPSLHYYVDLIFEEKKENGRNLTQIVKTMLSVYRTDLDASVEEQLPVTRNFLRSMFLQQLAVYYEHEKYVSIDDYTWSCHKTNYICMAINKFVDSWATGPPVLSGVDGEDLSVFMTTQINVAGLDAIRKGLNSIGRMYDRMMSEQPNIPSVVHVVDD